MKKLIVLVAGVLMFATPALALINNSKHDLPATFTGANVSDEVCVFCHTPHGANTAFSGGPLWNRNAGGSLTGKYSSSTLNAVIDTTYYDDIDAAACMSCHDGTQAMSSLVNPPNTGIGTRYNNTLLSINSLANIGTDMSNDHPVAFAYSPVVTADNEIKWPTDATIVANFKKIGGANWMQCSNCHDVHNTPATADRLLIMNNAGSNLCLACHIK